MRRRKNYGEEFERRPGSHKDGFQVKDMATDTSGRSLFIVDNSVSGWTGLRYLAEWASISRAFDIATGFFEIGALLALDGKWQKLDKIRVLMGAETNARSRRVLIDGLRNRTVERLDQSLGADKEDNPFLNGVPAILDAIQKGQIECRVYDRGKFHAKTYITHATLEVVGSQALVGSSNFTKPGLTENIELNVQVQSAREVAQLQNWFEEHWSDARDVSETVIEVIDRHTRLYSPFDVYAKALHELFHRHELTAAEWEETYSRMFSRLDRYQQEGYWALMDIARRHGGAFLCDGVGLGKTFVGLMLIERMVIHEGKRVVLLAPKASREGVWEPHLREWLPHIGGGADFSNLAVFSHTDLSRKGEFPERFERVAELADVVIIDEAHHFRNRGSRGGEGSGKDPSRYYRLYDLIEGGARAKVVFFLTATPINNRLTDFRHMMEIFTRQDEAYFAQTLGITNLRAYFNRLENEFRRRVNYDAADVADHTDVGQDLLSADLIFRELVVQRSRAYARESQLRERGTATAFPDRLPPQLGAYSIRRSYGRLLGLVDDAFKRENPLFTLPMYYPLHWYIGEEDIDPLEENRQRQVVGLIRTNFLKRFESSVVAFEQSCNRLLEKLLAFIETHSVTERERGRLERWRAQNGEALGYASELGHEFADDAIDAPEDDDILPVEMLEASEQLDREEYDVEEMLSETFLDLDQVIRFLDESRRFRPRHDDKLQKLMRLLKCKDLANQKVLIFTEFADTARYLKRELERAGVDGVAEVDSASTGNRAEVIRRFSPYYNGSSRAALVEANLSEIRILISTDVLSEGLNLQDASRMINYDIHWNPVRLMQRIGRVDRRMNPVIEARMIDDQPDLVEVRGLVKFWNFLPPDELNLLLTLYTRVTEKTLLISETLGIEGRKLLTPEDDYDALREFNEAYEGQRTKIEDMHLEYQTILEANPGLEAHLLQLPGGIFSGRERISEGVRGVFLCYGLPALDKTTGEYTEAAGLTRWYLYDFDTEMILEDPSEIAASVRSTPATLRRCTTKEQTLINIRTKVDKHIKNSYLKRVDAPVGVRASLKCWMELNEA